MKRLVIAALIACALIYGMQSIVPATADEIPPPVAPQGPQPVGVMTLQATCWPSAIFDQQIAEEFHEAPAVMGIDATKKRLAFVTATKDGADWTMAFRYADPEMVCVVAVGSDLKIIEPDTALEN